MEKFYSLKNYPEIETETKKQVITDATQKLRNNIIDIIYGYKYIYINPSNEESDVSIDLGAMLESKEFRETLEYSREQTRELLDQLKKGAK